MSKTAAGRRRLPVVDWADFPEETAVMREIRARLEDELRALERELTVDLPREIKTAVAMGDLRENAEYHAALERQRFVKARIGQLRSRLGELGMIRFIS